MMMRVEELSNQMAPAVETAVLDLRHEKDLYHLSPVALLATYYMVLGSEGLHTLPAYESLPGSVPIFYEANSVKVYREAVNKNTAAVVLGNIVISLEELLDKGSLDWEGFKKRHETLVAGTVMQGKITFSSEIPPKGRIKPEVSILQQKRLEDPTYASIINSMYSLPYPFEVLMETRYTILFDTGKEEPQRPVGSSVVELVRDSFQPLALQLLTEGMRYPLPQRFLDFLEGNEIREDVVAFLTKI